MLQKKKAINVAWNASFTIKLEKVGQEWLQTQRILNRLAKSDYSAK